MARFTQSGTGDGSGIPGPQGSQGNPGADGADGTNGSDGLDSLFLGTWNSVTEFLALYQGGPVGLAAGDWWAFVKDNTDPNKIYVVREDPNSATGWVIDDNEHFVLPAGADGESFSFRGAYGGAEIVYNLNDVVTYNGSSYICLSDNVTGSQPDSLVSWDIFVEKGADGADGSDGADGTDALWDYLGEYNGGLIYGAGAVVTYDGQLWYRNVYTSAGYAPGVGNTYWDLLAAKGADGADGNDGAPGAQGDPGSPGLVYLGNYVSGNGYIANLAVVKGSDNNLYIATSSGGLGDPVGNTAEWSIFLPKGADGAQGEPGIQGDPGVEQIQSDWTQTDNAELDYIKNKPTLPDLSGYGVPTSYNPVWSGTGLTYTGTPATGSYMKMNKMVTFRIKVNCATVAGASNSGFGSGQYYLTLPFAPVTDYIFRDGGIHHIGGPAHYQMSGDAEAGTTQLTLWYTTSQSQDQAMDYNSPHALQTPDHFYISGTYEAQ